MRRMILATGLMISAGSVAFAQQGAGGGQPMGSVDSAKAISSTREQNAEYNRTIGSRDQRAERKGEAVAATAADIRPGLAFRDVAGQPLGTIEAVEPDGAIVAIATGKVKIPLVAFGKDDSGLLLGITADELKAAVAKANTDG